ncbi:hypothetical protein HFN84_35415 [Rhizobium laguerreae]|nr:hypothetical protein [Rhizobium laguerreae]MBY3355902.1 hypothetical protein [Rhizobium laguerreae]MBY3369927.1 hypothetical protein [Rhizobium laguerreae]MBY3377054.1 hypothetical protein [Rhizobium laguerreae]MBY3390794.1 hypothetical protein [Rhizobium laguerreae]
MAEHGQDDEASAIICAATARLHQARKHQLPELLPLAHWFNAILDRPRQGRRVFERRHRSRSSIWSLLRWPIVACSGPRSRTAGRAAPSSARQRWDDPPA